MHKTPVRSPTSLWAPPLKKWSDTWYRVCRDHRYRRVIPDLLYHPLYKCHMASSTMELQLGYSDPCQLHTWKQPQAKCARNTHARVSLVCHAIFNIHTPVDAGTHTILHECSHFDHENYLGYLNWSLYCVKVMSTCALLSMYLYLHSETSHAVLTRAWASRRVPSVTRA